MPAHNALEKIGKLNERLRMLNEEKNAIEAEALKFAEKRNRLNEAVKQLKLEILQLREKRNQLNFEVQELKKQRTVLLETRSRIIEVLKGLRNEIKALEKNKPSRSLSSLQNEIKGLDWKIQTSIMSLEEERQIIERVKQLESQLTVMNKLRELENRRLEAEAELKAIEAKIDSIKGQMSEKASESQNLHEKMLLKIGEAEKTRIEADEAHKLFMQAREQSKKLQHEICAIKREIHLFKSQIQAEEEKRRKANEEAMMDEVSKRALEKLKRGEKLTWEEFKILAEKELAQD